MTIITQTELVAAAELKLEQCAEGDTALDTFVLDTLREHRATRCTGFRSFVDTLWQSVAYEIGEAYDNAYTDSTDISLAMIRRIDAVLGRPARGPDLETDAGLDTLIDIFEKRLA